jgi:hypothetical protein
MGLWILQIYHALDHQERLYPTYHDEHELDYLMVLDCHYFLVLRQDVQEVDEEFQGS